MDNLPKNATELAQKVRVKECGELIMSFDEAAALLQSSFEAWVRDSGKRYDTDDLEQAYAKGFSDGHGPLIEQPQPAFRIIADGDQFCAVLANFKNLEESQSGWGKTPQEALADLVGIKDSDDAYARIEDAITNGGPYPTRASLLEAIKAALFSSRQSASEPSGETWMSRCPQCKYHVEGKYDDICDACEMPSLTNFVLASRPAPTDENALREALEMIAYHECVTIVQARNIACSALSHESPKDETARNADGTPYGGVLDGVAHESPKEQA